MSDSKHNMASSRDTEADLSKIISMTCSLCKESEACFSLHCNLCSLILCCRCFMTHQLCTECGGDLENAIYFNQHNPASTPHVCVQTLTESKDPSLILNFHRNKRLLENAMRGDQCEIIDILVKLCFDQPAAVCQALFTEFLTIIVSNLDLQDELGKGVSSYFRDSKHRKIFGENTMKVNLNNKGRALCTELLKSTKNPNLKLVFRELLWATEVKKAPFFMDQIRPTNHFQHLKLFGSINTFLLSLTIIILLVNTVNGEVKFGTTFCNTRNQSILCRGQCHQKIFKKLFIAGENTSFSDLVFEVVNLRINHFSIPFGKFETIPPTLRGDIDDIFFDLTIRPKISLAFLAIVDVTKSLFLNPFFKLNQKYGFFRKNHHIFVSAPYFEIPLNANQLHLASFRSRENSQLDTFYGSATDADETFPCHLMVQPSINISFISTNIPQVNRLKSVSLYNLHSHTILATTNRSQITYFRIKNGFSYNYFVCNQVSAAIFPKLELLQNYHLTKVSGRNCILTIDRLRFQYKAINNECKPSLINCNEIYNHYLYLLILIIPFFVLFQMALRQNLTYNF